MMIFIRRIAGEKGKPLEGFEPSTCGLRNRRYATKPQRHLTNQVGANGY
jgi:hypothetical protein